MGSSNKELDKIKKIRESCKACNGVGYIVRLSESGDPSFNDCVCMQETIQRLNLLEARIPSRYQDWDFRSLTKKFKENNPKQFKYLKTYIDKIEEKVENGSGFWLASGPGLAKSSIVCYVLRSAMNQGIAAYFSRASHIISQKFDALSDRSAKETLEYIIEDVDILAIEELEKVYLGTDDAMNNQLFFEFLSDVYDSKKSIMVTSNIPRRDVLKRFPPYIVDRYSSLDYIPLIGESGRIKNDSI